MKKQWQVIVGFLLIFFIVVLALLNMDTVPINIGIATFQGPLILVILVSAFIGALIVLFSSSVGLYRKTKQIKELTKQLEAYDLTLEEKVAQKTETEKRQFDNEMAQLKADYETQLNQLKEQLNSSSQETNDDVKTQLLEDKKEIDYFN